MRLKRWLCLNLAIVLLFTLFPGQALAADSKEKSLENPKEESTNNLNEEDPLINDPESSVYQGYDIEPDVEADDEVLNGGASLYPDKKALLIQENTPWNSTANKTVLSSVVKYQLLTPAQAAKKDLSSYSIVVFSNDQSYSTYTAYTKVRAKLETYIKKGGVVCFGACDAGWANGKLVEDLPGGVTKANENDYRNKVADKTHPIVTAALSDYNGITDKDLYNNYCSHIYFNKSSLPEGTKIILNNSNNKPTLIEYKIGSGTVIASGLTWEHNYDRGERNGYGLFAKKVYDDLFLYCMKLATGGKVPSKSLLDYEIPSNKAGVFLGDYTTKKGYSNATITLSDGTKAVTDKIGVALFSKDDGNYSAKVDVKGFPSKNVTINLKKGKITPLYISGKKNVDTITIDKAIITKDNKDYNILTTRVYFDEKDTKSEYSYDFSSINLGSKKLKKFVLYQATNKILELTSTKGKIKPGETFSAESPIFLKVVCTDDSQSQSYKTGIFMKAATEFKFLEQSKSDEYGFGMGASFTISSKIPVLGGTTMSLGIGGLPVTITITDNKVKVAVGFDSDMKFGEAAWKDYEKKIDDLAKTAQRLEKLESLCKQMGAKSGAFTLKKGWGSPKFKVAGYMEGIYEGGSFKLTSGKILGGVGFNYSYNQQFIVGPVPVYFEVGVGFQLELAAQIQRILTDSKEIQLNTPITFTPSGTVGGGAGINGALSVGAEGKVSLPIEWDPANKHIKVTATGSMSLKASLLFVFSAKKEIAKGNWTICDKSYGEVGKADLLDDVTDESVYQALGINPNDYNEYTKEDLSKYSNAKTEWNNAINAKEGGEISEEVLENYVLNSSKAELLDIPGTDKKIMVFQSASYNKVSMMYSIFDGTSWSNPEEVWEKEGISDYNGQLKLINNEIYLVWQRDKDISDKEESDISQQEKISETTEEEIKNMAKNIEIAFAKFDNNSSKFIDQKYVTNNEAYDGIPEILSNGNTLTVLWLENSNGDVLNPAGSSKFVYSSLNGNAFSKETEYALVDTYVLTSDAKYVNGNLKIIFSADSDGNLSTTDDINLYQVSDKKVTALTDAKSQNNNEELDSAEYIKYLNPQIVDDKAYYSAAGTIYSYDLKTKATESVGVGSSTFKVIKDNNEKYVLFTQANASQNQDEYDDTVIDSTSIYKYKLGQGTVSKCTNISGNLENFDTTDGKFFLYTAYEKASTDNLQLRYQTAFEGNDLVLEGVSASDNDLENNAQKASLIVTNQGAIPSKGFLIKIKNQRTYDEKEVEISDTLAVGETKEIEFNFERSQDEELTNYRFELVNEEDMDSSNNVKEITLGYPDLSLDVEECYINNEIDVYATINNLTQIPANATLSVYEDSIDGKLFYQKNLESVTKENSNLISFSIDRSSMEVTPGQQKLYVIKVTTENEIAQGDNTYDLLVQTMAKEVTSISIENDAPALSYDYSQYKEKSVQLKYGVTPANADVKLNWESSNEKVVSVNQTGKITFKGSGQATIKASVDDATYDEIVINSKSINKTAPKGLKSECLTNQINLNWSALKSISNYEIYRATSKNGKYELLSRVSAKNYTDSDVKLGNKYFYKIRGYESSYGTYLYTNFSSIISAKCVVGVSQYLNISQYDMHKLSVSWYSVNSVNGYELYRATSKKGKYKKIFDGNSTYYADTAVSLGKTYYYKVRAYVNLNNKKIYGNFGKVMNSKLIVTAPYINTIEVAGSKQLYIRINPLKDITGYIIYEAKSYDGTYKKIAKTKNPYYLRKGLKKDTSYYYKVKAYKTIKKKDYISDFSYSYYQATTGFSYPYDISTCYNGKGTLIKFNKNADATGTEISFSSTWGGPYKVLTRTKKSSYLDKKLNFRNSGYYKFRSYKTVKKKTVYSDEKQVYCYSSLKTVDKIKAKRTSATSISLSWTKVAGATGYCIKRKIGKDYEDTGYYVISSNTGNTTKYVDSGLIPNTTYTYTICPIRDNYYGNYLPTATATTSIGSLSKIKSSVNSKGKVLLKWKKAKDAKSYTIYRSTDNKKFVKVKDLTAKSLSYTDKTTKWNKTYYYKIKAHYTYNGINYDSGFSKVLKVTVKKSKKK
ncbi:fibronectin type 3 domain-containing protein [Acetitomaculum ruminis DSM 5522]|uniref:Fibronectin type 3 domain-containing protein n=1 Tax=Acetitomaculum ruminis DSM 5522 TaxID=1120918 RepID=A0A1I0YKB7_9FIRM|nr:Ig-like domain-containing protein [Acetitomaculum ruminis]SFB13347.1 fibronectin type 3 domain-containing protein [Acetitomaculum ruminis DSM 5522]